MCFSILTAPLSQLVQHLPFHFLPMEVGPLYRVGSNMLSIRQLQCLPGVNLSYALVNAVGVSEFSEPQEQCFYGEGRRRLGGLCVCMCACVCACVHTCVSCTPSGVVCVELVHIKITAKMK